MITEARNAIQKHLGLARSEADAIVARLDLGQQARVAKVDMMPESARPGFVRQALGQFAPPEQKDAPPRTGIKIACCCVTWLRPDLLGQMVKCFLEQDYPIHLRELVILDDAGQYDHCSGNAWQLVSIPRRFATLGQKRNACMALASPDVDAYMPWDDDDLYMPWALSAVAAGLEAGEFVRPSHVLEECGPGRFKYRKTDGLFHGSWAIRRETMWRVGGYGRVDNGEDQDLSGRLNRIGVATIDPIAMGQTPYYCYRDHSGSYHLSWIPGDGYRQLGARPGRWQPRRLRIEWPYDLRTATIEAPR